ncbi:3-deoxy-7-phosphoheptulonate synthase [Anaeromyxobacter diazotrophicus]|uniref:Phospho-2-dehydro-3-deoxyheptonate aldolase n=1 Tax=Anaeromyxobacter diazotrophicus TaxID=2590199 RepID=A0A7I9VTB0_9BACT|nr:3-deoxy-7-phosphoheptulonate synthase [Anaeromyxobacter diazotrophicus]GEJ59370.1 phospho-2-dehydro-3-deoxyheptonate aldolase [Anaeromyxobacter diazotrophicus]
MPHKTDDVRIAAIHELAPPAHLIREFPCTERAAEVVHAARQALHRILHGEDDRLAVVVGPCSIHDVRAAREYAARLAAERRRLAGDLELVMRVYFEKPRTTVGWKGLINDPDLDGTFQINRGLRIARELLLDVAELGLPAGCEYLDMITPQYLADLVSWGAIGARTTESQVHRELASGLSCPVGFKNGTDGNVRIAVDAIRAAREPHHFLSVTKGGHSAIVATLGNGDGHLILRGGRAPNYDAQSVAGACEELTRVGLDPHLMIDASHANSRKDAQRQLPVCEAIAGQLAAGEGRIAGVMIESHLVGGRQDLEPGRPLAYGQSITDACLGFEDTVAALELLAAGVRRRREARRAG